MMLWFAIALLLHVFGSTICRAMGDSMYGMTSMFWGWTLQFVMPDWAVMNIPSITQARHSQISEHTGVTGANDIHACQLTCIMSLPHEHIPQG
jgi:hypothetical protein